MKEINLTVTIEINEIVKKDIIKYPKELSNLGYKDKLIISCSLDKIQGHYGHLKILTVKRIFLGDENLTTPQIINITPNALSNILSKIKYKEV